MKIAVIGTGYVGLVTGVCLAKQGHHVTCVDKDQGKIDALRQGIIPIYEPGLKELVDAASEAGRITFTADGEDAVASSEVIFIAVGTPPLPTGEADLTYVREAAAMIGGAMRGYRVIVNKSTVPVGTADLVAGIIAERTVYSFDVVSNPEFLREGAAVEDCLNPDRIVLGVRSERAKHIMCQVYQTFNAPLVVTDPRSAEMIKYAANAFLAVKISYINEIAALCEQVGSDVVEVARGMGLDPRIGSAFLKAGIGYGGSCFPKDTEALLHTAKRVATELPIVQAAVHVNAHQRERVVEKLGSMLGGLAGTTIGILGLAFKPHTDDVREAPAIDVIRRLAANEAQVRAYDPKGVENAKRLLAASDKGILEKIAFCNRPEDVAVEADAIVLITEWPEFANLSWEGLLESMRGNVLYDTRNALDPARMQELGFTYQCIGRGALNGVDVSSIKTAAV